MIEPLYAAWDCEESDDPDCDARRLKYDNYIRECENQSKQVSRDGASIGTYAIRCDYAERKNERPRLQKPNEDFQLRNEEQGFFILADGVTRPHSEYRNPELCNLAAECARELCQSIQNCFLQNTREETNPIERMTEALSAGNRCVKEFRKKKWEDQVSDLSVSYPPCCTLLLAYFTENTMFFYNCCDTIGFLIRNGVKMQFTDHYNWRAEIEGIPKQTVYQELHNNPNHEAGFAIVNGDDRFDQFIRIGQLQIQSGDRVILSSDGLAEFLSATSGDVLQKLTAKEMVRKSKAFDQAPFRKYADDKSCIIIDVL